MKAVVTDGWGICQTTKQKQRGSPSGVLVATPKMVIVETAKMYFPQAPGTQSRQRAQFSRQGQRCLVLVLTFLFPTASVWKQARVELDCPLLRTRQGPLPLSWLGNWEGTDQMASPTSPGKRRLAARLADNPRPSRLARLGSPLVNNKFPHHPRSTFRLPPKPQFSTSKRHHPVSHSADLEPSTFLHIHIDLHVSFTEPPKCVRSSV